MPPRVNRAKCDGCLSQSETFCVLICPGDLMALNPDSGKAYCRSERDCWDCMSCVKSCPHGAIETRLPYQLGYYPARLIPLVGSNKISWTVMDIHGNVERFTFKTRNDD